MQTKQLAIISLAILGIATVANASMIENGSFESGEFDPWVSVMADGSEPVPEMNWTISDMNPHSGEHCALAVPAASVYLRYDVGQLLVREVEELHCWVQEDHADLYQFDFFMEVHYVHADMPSVGRTFLKTFNIASTDWEHVDALGWLQWTNEAAETSWGEDKAYVDYIGFTGDPHEERFVRVDDVVLKLTPEPSSLALLAMGALGLLRRRRS